MRFLTFILAGLLITIGIFAFNQSSKAKEYQAHNQTLNKKVQELKQINQKLTVEIKNKTNNTEEQVKKDTEAFLKAFFVYDTSKGEAGWNQIQPYTTENGKKMLTPPGIEPNQKPEKTDPDKSVQSGIDKMLLYYTPVENNKANVFARVWQKTTANNVSSVTQLPLDIQLVFDQKQKRWVVDAMTIQQPLKQDGYVN